MVPSYCDCKSYNAVTNASGDTLANGLDQPVDCCAINSNHKMMWGSRRCKNIFVYIIQRQTKKGGELSN